MFWRPEVLPTVIPLALSSFATARPLDIGALGNVVAEQTDIDGRHVLIRSENGDFRLWLADPPDQPLAVVLPLDDDLPIRTAATLRLWARMMGQGDDPERELLTLTRQRRDRLVLTIRALDGHLAEASYREIAEMLFGARRIERETWKASSLRDRTIRLVKSGIALMRAGYRKLLRSR